jgi:hypothetical protein
MLSHDPWQWNSFACIDQVFVVSTSLRKEFFVDILKSRANECLDNFLGDLEGLLKVLGRL